MFVTLCLSSPYIHSYYVCSAVNVVFTSMRKLMYFFFFITFRGLFLLKNPFFWNIINSGLRSNNGYVSPDIKKMLIKSFTVAITSFEGHEEKRKEYLNQVFIRFLRYLLTDFGKKKKTV